MATRQGSVIPVGSSRAADVAAFEELVPPLLDSAYRLACGMLQDRNAAEDAVQEAALNAWRKWYQLKEGSKVRPWFLAIVANECRSARRLRWWSVVGAEPPELAVDAPDEAIVAGMELRDALRTMAVDKRLVLVLHWYLDLPLEEIAGITGLGLRGAETRLSRATNELKRRMEAHRGRR